MTKQPKRLLVLAAATLIPLLAGAAEPIGAAVELRAKGVQIYSCANNQGSLGWKLKAPEAALSDPFGHIVARHFVGPTWQAADGSTVVGTPVVASASPDGTAIPWLVLQATAHEGPGLFSEVAYIVRTRTVGGLAPASGCDATHQAVEVRVPYSATYSFFTPIKP